MNDPHASNTISTTPRSFVQDGNQNLFSGLRSIVPTTDNRHTAFRFLLDTESQVDLSLPSDSPSLNGPASVDATSLTAAKLTLKGVHDPERHPILDECKHQMASGTNLYEDDHMFYHATRFSSPTADADDYPLACLFSDIGAELEPSTSHLRSTERNEVHMELNTTSTYSSLLPEWHCPPFATLAPFEQPASPSFNDLPSPYDSTIPSTPSDRLSPTTEDACIPETHRLCDPQHCSGYPSHSTSCPCSAFAFSVEDVTQPKIASEELYWTTIDAPPSAPLAPANHAAGHSDSSHDGNRAVVGLETQNPEASSPTEKHKRRTFHRPPGLPLGAWTPSDTNPFPSTILPRKPRKVQRGPSNRPEPATSSQQGRRDKVSCPECSALLLPKSLNRHRERHFNWTEGEYNAHLYCRYCFAAYSRMDTLIHHQKTDLQCVLLQYKIYWKERQSHLEETFRTWTATADRV